MLIIAIIFGVLLVSFWGVSLSCPARWFKWNDWNEHLRTHHSKETF